MGPLARRRAGDASRDDRGATAVEFALLFPLFLAICFGTISGGILFSDKLAITQGAREGARYGATHPFTTGAESVFLEEVLKSARDAAYGQMGTGDVTYCASLRTSTGFRYRTMVGSTAPMAMVTGAPCPGTNTVANPLPADAHVAVTASKPASLNLLLYTFSPGIESFAVARYEGEL